VKKAYTVRAKRWEGGWELHVDGVGVTQSRTLETAETQVRDLIETMLDSDAGGVDVVILPELDGLAERAEAVRRATEEVAVAQRAAAAEARAVAAALRGAGLSVADVAAVMKVSRGRASQLLRDAEAPRERVSA
jgi:predicted RNase H-like HicB family nuclease